MDENKKKWLWLGLGVAAGAGVLWWLNRRGQKAAASAAAGQLPVPAPTVEGGQATDGQVSGYQMGEAPPPPAQIVTQAPQSVPDNGNYTQEGAFDENDEF